MISWIFKTLLWFADTLWHWLVIFIKYLWRHVTT